jgi:hypothetical protein
VYDLPGDMKPNGNSNLPPGQLPLPRIGTPASYTGAQDTPPLDNGPPLRSLPPGPTPFTAINGSPHTSYAPQNHAPQNHHAPYPPPRQQQHQPPQPQQQHSPEDWSFLQSFGDATDEFYALDVELRGLLDNPEFVGGNSRFI